MQAAMRWRVTCQGVEQVGEFKLEGEWKGREVAMRVRGWKSLSSWQRWEETRQGGSKVAKPHHESTGARAMPVVGGKSRRGRWQRRMMQWMACLPAASLSCEPPHPSPRLRLMPSHPHPSTVLPFPPRLFTLLRCRQMMMCLTALTAWQTLSAGWVHPWVVPRLLHWAVHLLRPPLMWTAGAAKWERVTCGGMA